jgi:alpha-L-rhamnosidase
MKRIAAVLTLALLAGYTHGQNHNPVLLTTPWKSTWITGPGEPVNIWTGVLPESRKKHVVYKFRKTITLSSQPSTFIVHVSADNRYKLFVNGTMVSLGPARGDLLHWNFETVDLGPHLKAGENTVAALVWNEGPARPEAQISLITAFIMQGNSEAEEVLNTNDSWKVVQDESYAPLVPRTTGYYVAGPGEMVRMNAFIRGWEVNGFNDTKWEKAQQVVQGVPKGVFTFAPGTWMLVPSMLPQMEMSVQRLASVKKATGINVPATFPAAKSALTLPANGKYEILFDNGVLTNAYPTLVFSGGSDAGISLGYAEALYIRKNENLSGYRLPNMPKGNRDEVEGKIFVGRRDSLISDGTKSQSFTSLWYRTYRYVLLRVETRNEALVIDDLYGTFTGYPFHLKAEVQSIDQSIGKNLEVGWRTARLCATETYMDCPYYEQLQYFGDTRIQALVTMFNTNDDRLVKNAIIQADRSRIAEGITMSRYPTASTQIIPPFSLWWIGMVHDYWMYRGDEDFIRSMLPGTREVLHFFSTFQQPDGSIKNLPYWTFSDWVNGYGWKDGVAPKGMDGNSSILDLQLLLAYEAAAILEDQLGLKDLSAEYNRRAKALASTISHKYWDMDRKMFSDTGDKDLFSQHANSLAILAGLVSGQGASDLAKAMMADSTLAPASIYFKYYLHQAYVKAGFGDDYMKWLDKWNENIAMGLTTWAEMSDVGASRSDCHAWGSSPNIEFYRTVLGIDSSAPGFKKVRIEPHLGSITSISGSIPHPAGTVSTSYTFGKKAWTAIVTLPDGINGEFVWKGKTFPLNPGKNQFTL